MHLGLQRRILILLCTILALVGFCAQFIVILKNGANRTQIYVQIITAQGSGIESTVEKISIVSPWSEMLLNEIDNIWSFKDGQLRDATDIVLDIPKEVESSKLEAYLALRQLPSHSNSNQWTRMTITPITEGRLLPPTLDSQLSRYHLTPRAFRPSILQQVTGKDFINWGGDFSLILRSAMFPLTISGTVFLILYGVLLGRSASFSKTAPNKPLTVPSQSDRVHGLDELRGIAIIMVVAFHTLYAVFGFDQLGWNGSFPNFDHPQLFLLLSPATIGYGGVAIFFAISGFCIHLSYEKSSNKSLTEFYKKRWFRIYPPYFASLVLFAFLFPTTRYLFNSTSDFYQYYSEVLLVFNLSKETFWACNGVYWSVAVEWQLYLIYPLFLFLARRFGWQALLISAFFLEISLRSGYLFDLLRLELPSASFALCNSAPGYSFTWLVGAKLADDYLKGKTSITRRIPLSACFICVILTQFFRPLSLFSYICFSLLSVALMARLLEENYWPKLLPFGLHRSLAFIGATSYSIYLFHQPILNAVSNQLVQTNADDNLSQLLRLATCVLGWFPIVVIAWFSYLYLELPSIRTGKFFLNSPRN